MLMCYVDESGDTGLFDANERNSQPVFLLCALIVNQSHLESITREVIQLKQKHFPSYSQGTQHWHDCARVLGGIENYTDMRYAVWYNARVSRNKE